MSVAVCRSMGKTPLKEEAGRASVGGSASRKALDDTFKRLRKLTFNIAFGFINLSVSASTNAIEVDSVCRHTPGNAYLFGYRFNLLTQIVPRISLLCSRLTPSSKRKKSGEISDRF